MAAAYADYDIIIWSATGMKWVEVKMRELGVSTNPSYKITCFLDHMAMVTVFTDKYGKWHRHAVACLQQPCVLGLPGCVQVI